MLIDILGPVTRAVFQVRISACFDKCLASLQGAASHDSCQLHQMQPLCSLRDTDMRNMGGISVPQRCLLYNVYLAGLRWEVLTCSCSESAA